MVFRALAKNGEKVEEGQVVFILEAMKMESEITARRSGVITVRVQQGDQVQTGQVLAEIN
jgi:oxaloacetate decarboxylase alpha subunit